MFDGAFQRIFSASVVALLVTATPAQANSDPSPLLVAEANAAHEVNLTDVAQSRVEFSITVLNRTKDTVKNIIAQITDFKSGRLEPFAAKIEISKSAPPSEGFDLDPFKSKQLSVSVDLPNPGVYTARLAFTINDEREMATVVKIVRTVKPPSLDISDIPPILVNVPWFGGGTSAKQDVRIRDNGGVEVKLRPPELMSLTYKPKDSVSFFTPGATLVLSKDVDTVIKAGGESTMKIALMGVPNPGRYDATVRFSVPGATPIDKAFAVYARQNWTIAAAFIAAGVLVAFMLRLLTTVLAPRYVLQNRVSVLFQQLHECALQGADDRTVASVVERLRRALSDQWDGLAATARIVGSSSFDLYEAKIPLLQNWVRLRKWLPPGFPDAIRKLADQALGEAQKVLDNPAATAADITLGFRKLGALPTEVSMEAATALATAVGKLQTELQSSTDPDDESLREKLKEVAKIADASPEALVGAFARMNTLRLQYVRKLSRALRLSLEVKPPIAMDDGEWAATTERTTDLLNAAITETEADRAVEAYHAAIKSLFRPLAAALIFELANKIGAAGPDKPGYEVLKTRADTVLADIDSGRLADVASKMSKLLSDYESQGSARFGLGGEAGAAQPAFLTAAVGASSAAATGILDFGGFAPLAGELEQPRGAASARTKTAVVNGLVVVIILVLAVLLGVKALWADDWTWGGGTAYLVAFLWGAGLSGFSYDGLSNLLNRFKSP